jgi:myo-inositol-1(or 4)-monophosphatase
MDNSMIKVRGIMTEIAEFALHSLPVVDSLSVRTKRDAADLVSNRDYAMESKIIETIHRVFPEHAVISEEIGVVGNNSQHQWLVDPIDGSCNDSHSIPWSSVSVAYVKDGKIMAGTVVNPHTGEVFQAVQGEGATLNNQPIYVSNAKSLSGSVVMTELLNQRPWNGMFQFVNYLASRDATVRIMGSTALALTQVAAGRAVAAILADAGQLDVAAGILIATESGAVVLQDGKPLTTLPRGRLVVTCPGVATDIEKAPAVLSQ